MNKTYRALDQDEGFFRSSLVEVNRCHPFELARERKLGLEFIARLSFLPLREFDFLGIR